MDVKNTLLTSVQPSVQNGNKVTIVGVGAVGMACAVSIILQQISSEICLVDTSENKLRGEMLDLQHCSMFLKNLNVTADSDYSITSDSKLCIVAAGCRQQEHETRLDLVHRNVDVMKAIVPELVKYSPEAILLIVTNPVDVMTYFAWKISGLPSFRVIGSGTNLDTARFRFLLGEKLGVVTRNCQAWIIGEHGDSSVAVWSGVNVAGVRLKELNPNFGTVDDLQRWSELHNEVVDSAYEVIKLKGYTCWAIGMCVASIADSILNNREHIKAVSILAKGYHGITQEVFLSLPVVLGAYGVKDVIKQALDVDERRALHVSASTLAEVQANVKL